jgi:tRNA(adenine34) deaminase
MQAIDETFMGEALSLAEDALAAGEFPVGCVFVHDNRVVARGTRVGSAGAGINEIDHAEIMALREFYRLPSAPDPKDISAYCTLEPCLMCFAALVIAGIGRIVYAYEDAMGGGTDCQLETLSPYYRDRRPLVVPHTLREESLKLFQTFFQNPETDYLKDSHLATYTLSQHAGSPPEKGGDPNMKG